MTSGADLQMDAICRWDNKSVELLYDHFYRALVSYALQFVEQEVAEDIVQEVFATLWERKPSFTYLPQLVTYLYHSTRNTALNHLRHENVQSSYRQEVLSAQDGTPTDDTADAFNKEEVYRQLFLAIDQLPTRQREVFLLAMEGKKNKEIASLLAISTETVKVQKRRAVSTLKDTLSPHALLFLLPLL